MRESHSAGSGVKKVLPLEEKEEEAEGLWAETSRHNAAWPLASNVDAT